MIVFLVVWAMIHCDNGVIIHKDRDSDLCRVTFKRSGKQIEYHAKGGEWVNIDPLKEEVEIRDIEEMIK